MTPASPVILPAPVDAIAAEPLVSESFLRRWLPLWVWLACIVVGLIANAPALRGDAWIWTDRALVADNTFLSRSAGLADLWTGIASPGTYPLPIYSPLTQTTFFLDRIVWGDRLWGYRLTSILLHATAGLMVFQLLRRLAVRGAIVATILFVAHPLTVESAVWLTERRNALAAIFGLASAFVLLRAAGLIKAVPGARFKPLPEEPSRLYGLAAVLHLLGLFASPTIATLPLLVPLIAWWKQSRIDARALGVIAATVLLGIGMLFASSAIERSSVGVAPAAWKRDLGVAGDVVARVQVAGRAVAFYATKFVLPAGIEIDYPRWTTPADAATLRARDVERSPIARYVAEVGAAEPAAFVFAIGVVAALCIAWQSRQRLGRGPIVVLGGFVLLLIPSLGFVDLGWMRYAFVANRAAYLPSALLMAGLVAAILPQLRTLALQRAGWAVAALGLITLLLLSLTIAGRYADELGFWRHAKQANPRSWLAVEQLAAVQLARPTPDLAEVGKTIGDAYAVRPREPSLLRLDAIALLRLGHDGAALTQLRAALEVDPTYAAAHATAGDVFRYQALANPTAAGPRIESRAAYKAAVDLSPRSSEARLRLAEANAEIVRRLAPNDPHVLELVDEATTAVEEAVRLRPYDVNGLLFGAKTLMAVGKISDAAYHLNAARVLAPRRAAIYFLMAEASTLAADPIGAEVALQEGLARDPNNVRGLVNLGALRQTQKRWDEARVVLEKAITQAPADPEAAARLADVEAKQPTVWPRATTQATTQATTRAVIAP